MNRPFATSIQRATALTRAGSLAEATRTIQQALLGSQDPPAEVDRPASGGDIASPRILDLEAVRTDGRQRPGTHSGTAAPDLSPPNADTGRGRRARPLADTIRDLANGRKAFGGLQPGRRSVEPPTVPDGARYVWRDHACPAGKRAYRLYVPASAEGGARGLVMMLHGCKQDPDDFAAGTAMNARAEAAGMVVVYPRQPNGANPSACWNWFNPGDQGRGSGEPAILAALARSVAEEFAVPQRAVFVAGLSAGGAMAAILAETYPDVFSAAGIHSGLPAGAAEDMASAFAAMAGRRAGRPRSPAGSAATRLIVFHGTADTIVHLSNGEAIVASRRDRSASTERHSGRTEAGRRFQRTVHRSADGAADTEHWVLEGHGHAWSGGRPSGSYTDPAGPDASAEMIRFFQEGSPTSP